jgi:hypothetical protein
VHFGSDSDWIKALFEVFFGWALSSLSRFVLAVGERQKAISKALSDLLEIRRQLLVVEAAFEHVRKVIPSTSPQEEAQLRGIMEQLLVPVDSVQLSRAIR